MKIRLVVVQGGFADHSVLVRDSTHEFRPEVWRKNLELVGRDDSFVSTDRLIHFSNPKLQLSTTWTVEA